jgi:predicted nuclease with TOPRIM domain
MTKQFSIKLDEEVIRQFDDIHSGLGNSTKGETFSHLVEKYTDFSENQAAASELTERLSKENQKLSEDFQKISEEYRKLSEDFQRLSEENQTLKTGNEELSNKDLEINRLTEENQKISKEYRELSDKLTEVEKTLIFKPEIQILLNAVCEVNERKPADLLAVIFAAWMDDDEPKIIRLKRGRIAEILQHFNNN